MSKSLDMLQAEARLAIQIMVAEVGFRFHPDTDPAEYGLDPATADRYRAELKQAKGVIDVYGFTLELVKALGDARYPMTDLTYLLYRVGPPVALQTQGIRSLEEEVTR
jgi:hypothetical protein